ncbi:hypothetical protein PENSPDRAFT_584288 [Peniophora sp. CONT]|nr:hypothetical protein PENSPDRAFT_584288 [Peniophora sp. CONT]
MSTNSLHLHPLFANVDLESLRTDERVSLSYQRARLILKTYDLTPADVLNYSPKFWSLHLDPVNPLDIACFTILAAHTNLTVGTLARYLDERPDLKPLVASMLRLDTVGIYLLSERGHGLDSFNNETTATRTPDGGYILNTPREEATKFMPASTPLFGVRKVALVMARLIVNKEDRGHRWFIVPICDETQLYPGVVSKRLPTRSGTAPLDFSLTSFHDLLLPESALLGSSLEAPVSPHEAWWNEVWRIPLGSMAISAPFIQAIKQVAYIGGKYSSHRTIAGRGPVPIPIITFPTQQWPILSAIAIANVVEAWYKGLITVVVDKSLDPRVRHGLAVVVKTTIMRHFQQSADLIAERCGAQGTFECNFIARIICDCKGAIIAEGDVLTLCIRLFSELLMKRYFLPFPAAADCLLARRAHSVLDDNITLVQSLPGGHRGQEFQSLILPQAENSVAAFGHAMAYAAAREAGVPQYMLDIYELSIAELDAAWFLEHAKIGKVELLKRRAGTLAKAMPNMHVDLEKMGVAKVVQASIVTEDGLKASFERLPTWYGRSAGQRSDAPAGIHVAVAKL